MCPELIIVRKQNEVIKRVEASGLGQIVSLRCVHLKQASVPRMMTLLSLA